MSLKRVHLFFVFFKFSSVPRFFFSKFHKTWPEREEVSSFWHCPFDSAFTIGADGSG